MVKINGKIYKYLFLDRDGVINIERPNDYVKNTSEFTLIKGTVEAIDILTQIFDKTVIITNQRGVGRGIMTHRQLDTVHQHMLSFLGKQGHIDNIYYSTDLKSTSINRKPNIGMGYQAQADFPVIDFQQSIMVGNSKSDIVFGQKLGMYTVLVGDKYPMADNIYSEVDEYCGKLLKFAQSIQNYEKE